MNEKKEPSKYMKFGAALAGITPIVMLLVVFLCGVFVFIKLAQRLWSFLVGG